MKCRPHGFSLVDLVNFAFYPLLNCDLRSIPDPNVQYLADVLLRVTHSIIILDSVVVTPFSALPGEGATLLGSCRGIALVTSIDDDSPQVPR